MIVWETDTNNLAICAIVTAGMQFTFFLVAATLKFDKVSLRSLEIDWTSRTTSEVVKGEGRNKKAGNNKELLWSILVPSHSDVWRHLSVAGDGLCRRHQLCSVGRAEPLSGRDLPVEADRRHGLRRPVGPEAVRLPPLQDHQDRRGRSLRRQEIKSSQIRDILDLSSNLGVHG